MASHIRFWSKLSLRVLAVWGTAAALLLLARPEPRWLAAGAAPVALGAILRIWAAGHLEKNKKLTVTGPYAFVKNPLYLGTFLVMAGFCVMSPARHGANWIVLALGALLFAADYAPRKMRVEYGRLRERFGEAFEAYDRAVPDYLPTLRPYRGGNDRWRFGRVLENSELWITLTILAGVALLALRWKCGWTWVG